MVSKSDLRSMYPEALLLGDRLVVPWRWIEVATVGFCSAHGESH